MTVPQFPNDLNLMNIECIHFKLLFKIPQSKSLFIIFIPVSGNFLKSDAYKSEVTVLKGVDFYYFILFFNYSLHSI